MMTAFSKGASVLPIALLSANVQGVPLTDKGQILEVWRKKEEGGWKSVADTWNSDLPLAPAA